MDFKDGHKLPNSFSPTDYIFLPLEMVIKNSYPIGSKVSGYFPSRIHISPIDCNKFAFSKPGGGGVGFGIISNNYLSLTVSNEFSYQGPEWYRPTVRRAIAVAEKALNLNNNSFHVTLILSPEISSHCGLGSNAIIQSSILFAVNKLFNKPLHDEEIRFLVASNFAESDQGMCCPGLETGLASAILAYGGFNLIGDQIVHIWQHPIECAKEVYLAKLEIPRSEYSGSEDEDMLARSLKEDLNHRGIRSYNILMDLIPAISEGNLKKIGDAIWDIQFGGTHLSMIQSYGHKGAEIYDFICNARYSGIEVVGMSSVGPFFFLISSDNTKVESFLKSRDIEYFKRYIQNNSVYSGLHVE
jgi:predicted sugar kinase